MYYSRYNLPLLGKRSGFKNISLTTYVAILYNYIVILSCKNGEDYEHTSQYA